MDNFTMKGRNMQMNEYIPNYVFYIPFAYVLLARMGTWKKSVSLFLIYVVPTLYYFLLAGHFNFALLPIYLICITLIYTIYEIGYIQNDTETIKFEMNPSIRLWSKNFSFYEHFKCSIYTTRIIIAIILSFLLLYVAGITIGTAYFLFFAWLILLIYQIYNKSRSGWILFFFICLQNCRYLSYLFLLYPEIKLNVVIALFVKFPLCIILERASHPRYHLWLPQIFISNIGKLPYFRVYYYLIVSILMVGWVEVTGQSIWLCFGVFYFFVYRLVICLAVKIWGKPKNYLIR